MGIDAVLFAGGEQGVDHGGVLGCCVCAREHVVFAAQRDRPDGVFYKVVVDL